MINPELNINKWFYSLLALFLLFHILWFNILPFGYEGEYVYDLSADKLSKYITLEGFQDISCDVNNKTCYQSLNQSIGYIIFKSPVIIKNSELTVEIKGKNISLIPHTLNLDIANVKWNNSWYLDNPTISREFNVEYRNLSLKKEIEFNNCGMIFDGNTKIILPNTQDKFESGPFSMYVEWIPALIDDRQEIVGHYNWELFQDKDKVSFQIGRMNNIEGQFYTITYPIKENFFNTKHTAVMIYNPSENGYFELYIDNNFVDRIYFKNSVIYSAYGDKPLSIGWSSHNYENYPYYKGCISKLFYVDNNIINNINLSKITFQSNDIDTVKIPVINIGSLNSVIITKNGAK